MSDETNPLENMEVFTRKYPTHCPDCNGTSIRRLAHDIVAYGIPMTIDENVFQCQDNDCGVIWDEDGDS